MSFYYIYFIFKSYKYYYFNLFYFLNMILRNNVDASQNECFDAIPVITTHQVINIFHVYKSKDNIAILYLCIMHEKSDKFNLNYQTPLDVSYAYNHKQLNC